MSEEKQQEEQTESTPEAAVPVEAVILKKAKRTIIGAVVVIVVIFILAGAAGAYWTVYKQEGDSAFRTWLIQTLPFPAATVNGQWVSYEQFEKNIEATKYFYDQQASLGLGIGEAPDDATLRSDELERMIDIALLEQIAEERGLAVTQEEIDTYFSENILPQAVGGEKEVEETLQTLYNWSVDEFKQNVLREVVLINEIDESVKNDGSVSEEELKAEADAVYQEVTTSGRPFSEVATQYSDDPGSAANGGSLGFFGRGVMVQEFEEAAYALEIGGISEPVRTDFGFHIINVTNKDTEADTVEASHILIAASNSDDLLAEKKADASISRLAPGIE